MGELDAAEAARKAAADARAAAETALAEADRAARAALEAMGAAREARAASEQRLEGARQARDELIKTIESELDVAPTELPALAGLAAGEAPPEADGVERKLESLKQERERLGAVNLRADEELAEVTASRDKLVAERDDLTEAIKRLRQAIQNLNQEGRERLLGAFEVVNKHFGELFATLFEGGTAELQLIESDDPLEAGLEILARPPGKKPQTLTLLSGGEQALTAMALIFAVFLTNPSPICVLDEVDAPLDDYNVERFCDLLDEMGTPLRHALRHHHPQSDHHGAHGPAVRRHHGRARRQPARLGRPRRSRAVPRGELRRALIRLGRLLPAGEGRRQAARQVSSSFVKRRQARRLTARQYRQRNQRLPSASRAASPARGTGPPVGVDETRPARRDHALGHRVELGEQLFAPARVLARRGAFDGAVAVEAVEHPQQPVDRAEVAFGDGAARRAAAPARAGRSAPAHGRASSRLPPRRAPWRRSGAPARATALPRARSPHRKDPPAGKRGCASGADRARRRARLRGRAGRRTWRAAS